MLAECMLRVYSVSCSVARYLNRIATSPLSLSIHYVCRCVHSPYWSPSYVVARCSLVCSYVALDHDHLDALNITLANDIPRRIRLRVRVRVPGMSAAARSRRQLCLHHRYMYQDIVVVYQRSKLPPNRPRLDRPSPTEALVR